MREGPYKYDHYLLATTCHLAHKKGCAFPPHFERSHLPRGVVFRRKTCILLLLSVSMTCAMTSLAVLTLCLSCPLLASPVNSDRALWTESRDIDYQVENDLSAKFTPYNEREHPEFVHRRRDDIKLQIEDIKSEIEQLGSLEDGEQEEEDYDSIAQNKESPRRRLPDAIIIGVKKAGTRALLEFLRIHPDVRAPGPEPHFFDRYYDRGYEWYRRQMPASMEGQLTMEKTPSYFITKEAPGRIRKMNPGIKLILVVRDPVTRAISDYTQALSKRDDVKPFEEMAFVDNATGIVDVSWGAVKIGIYAKHFDRWQVHFPPNQIHIVNGEKLIEEPAKEMAKVQSFLGLKTVINDKHFYYNATKGFPCLKKPEHSGNPHCLGRTKGRPHPSINPLAVQRLKAFFKPFNQKFYQMVGEDFGWN